MGRMNDQKGTREIQYEGPVERDPFGRSLSPSATLGINSVEANATGELIYLLDRSTRSYPSTPLGVRSLMKRTRRLKSIRRTPR